MPTTPPGSDVRRLVFSLDEVSSLLGLSRETTRQAIIRGEIRAVRVGRRYLVPRDAIADLLDRNVGP